MKKLRKYFVILLVIMSTVTAYGATYTLVSANYPINVNGQKIAVEPLNYNGTTYLPLKSISEAVGVPIEWTGKSVDINTVDVDALKEACVKVLAQNPDDGIQGSGVYIDYDEILTAKHVVDGMDRFTVNGRIDLKLKDSDRDTDSAILETPHKAKPVKIGDSDDVEIGDRVMAIGAPGDAEDTVTHATVVRIDEYIYLGEALEKGASGSPVFDASGNLIGLASMAEANLNETYVVPINQIREAL